MGWLAIGEKSPSLSYVSSAVKRYLWILMTWFFWLFMFVNPHPAQFLFFGLWLMNGFCIFMIWLLFILTRLLELALLIWLQVDVVVTTAGGIEEDLVKCLAPTFKGDFALPGAYLRSKGLNRIGNLLVPNDNYCKFEDWIIPIFDQMLKEQNEEALSHLSIIFCSYLCL